MQTKEIGGSDIALWTRLDEICKKLYDGFKSAGECGRSFVTQQRLSQVLLKRGTKGCRI